MQETDHLKGQGSEYFQRLTWLEQLNFLLTNRIPRRMLTLLMGRFSGIENPLLARVSVAIWNLTARELDLSEAKKDRFTSLNDCFIRELKDGARTVDQRESVIISPCDGIVGAFGKINGTRLFQAKGFPYTLEELLPDETLVEKYRDGHYITIRLKSTMYHRFHAPCPCRVTEVNYVSGDTWNVNPVAVKKVEKLYCKNERAVLDLQLEHHEHALALVPVAAVLVASMQFHCLEAPLNLQYKGPNRIPCDGRYTKGEEMGYFQHGSTIIVFSSHHLVPDERLYQGLEVKMGQPLLTIRQEGAARPSPMVQTTVDSYQDF